MCGFLVKRLAWIVTAFCLTVTCAGSDVDYALVPDWTGSAEDHDIDLGQLPFRLRLEASEPTFVLVSDWPLKIPARGRVSPKLVTIEIRRPGNREFEQVSPAIIPIEAPPFTARMVNSDDRLTLVVDLGRFFGGLDLSSAREIECRLLVKAYQYDSNKKKFVVAENLVSSPISVRVSGTKILDARADVRFMNPDPIRWKKESFFEK
jgi:hypothetical protein